MHGDNKKRMLQFYFIQISGGTIVNLSISNETTALFFSNKLFGNIHYDAAKILESESISLGSSISTSWVYLTTGVVYCSFSKWCHCRATVKVLLSYTA
jgi:hypothetical protein